LGSWYYRSGHLRKTREDGHSRGSQRIKDERHGKGGIEKRYIRIMTNRVLPGSIKSRGREEERGREKKGKSKRGSQGEASAWEIQ